MKTLILFLGILLISLSTFAQVPKRTSYDEIKVDDLKKYRLSYIHVWDDAVLDMKLSVGGNTYIGNSYANDTLDILAKWRYLTGAGSGKIWQSDANGFGSWQTVNGFDSIHCWTKLFIDTVEGCSPIVLSADTVKTTGDFSVTGDYRSDALGNTRTGTGALSIATGGLNIAFGYQAGLANTTGTNNCFIGWQTGLSNTTGSANTAMGQGALLANTIGSENTAYGWEALADNIDGSVNLAIGEDALLTHMTGDSNTAVGIGAGAFNVSGERNLFIGFQAGYNETGSDKLYISNSATATPLIKGVFPNDSLIFTADYSSFSGNVKIDTISPYYGTTTTFPQNVTIGNGNDTLILNTDTATEFINSNDTIDKWMVDTLLALSRIGINMPDPTTWFHIRTGQTSDMGVRFDNFSTTTTHTTQLAFGKSCSNTLGALSQTLNGSTIGTLDAYAVTSGSAWAKSSSLKFNEAGAAGSACGLVHLIYSGPTANSNATYYDKFAVTYLGKVSIAGMPATNITTNPNYSWSSSGNGAQSMGMEDNLIATSHGNPNSISAGGPTAAYANGNAGILYLGPNSTGQETHGSGMTAVMLSRSDRMLASGGTTDNLTSIASVIPSTKPLDNNSATTIFTCTILASDTVIYGNTVSGTIPYFVSVKGTDGTQSESGMITYTGTYYGVTTTVGVGVDYEREALSSGTIVVTPTLTYAGGVWTIQINVNSSLTTPVIKFDYQTSKGSSAPTFTQN